MEEREREVVEDEEGNGDEKDKAEALLRQLSM